MANEKSGLNKVWVLYGGPSSEREVSINTAKNVISALETKNYSVEGFDVQPGTLLDLDWSKRPDIVFLALHGTFGEDGTIQGFLESVGVPYVGSGVFSSAVSFHKGVTKKMLVNFGLPTPASYEVIGEEGVNSLAENIFAPSAPDTNHKFFIKASRQGSTVGIYPFDGSNKEKDEAKKEFISLCFKALQYDSNILVEEWVVGREISVPIIGGKAFPAVEIQPESGFYDYEAKYTKGKTKYLCPAPVSEAEESTMAKIAEKTFEVMECADYGRVDFILNKNGPTVLEVNTLPGLTSTSLLPQSAQQKGMGYPDLMEHLIQESFKRQKAGN